MAETKKQLKERVSFIVKKPRISLIAALCMVLICAIVAGCVAAGPVGDQTSSAAPTEQDEMMTIYVVTGQKNYKNGEIESTATFAYDDRGRPTMVEFVRADGTGRKSELAYDEQGNLIGDTRTYLYADSSKNHPQQINWNLTYTDDLLTRAERNPDGYTFTFSYNKQRQLVLVEYPQPEKGVGGDFWQSYDYDADGKLTRETRCHHQSGEYIYSRYCYFYDEQGRMAEQHYCYAVSDTCLDPEALDQLEFKISPFEQFFFRYDEEGGLAYVGDGQEDTYPGIYSDEKYTFDENGNLVRVDQGKGWGQSESSWIEYTYEAIELSKSDAIMHKRLIHGISNFTLSYTDKNTMDPLFWEMCPTILYSNNLQNMTFYYLIPYPQFELFL